MTEKEFLCNGDSLKYEKPAVTTEILVFTIGEEQIKDIKKVQPKKLKLLLVKHKQSSFKDTWVLPESFIQRKESLEEAVYRKIKEEMGITKKEVYLEQLYTYDTLNRDPGMRVIAVTYMALIPNSTEIKWGNDCKEAKWFEVSMQEKSKETLLTIIAKEITISYVYSKKEKKMICNSKNILAFDHEQMILMALLRLRNKVKYTSIVFSLLPDKFTLMELQQVYELLLQNQVTKQNFRKKMLSKVIKLGEVQEKTGFRPAHYFSYYKE